MYNATALLAERLSYIVSMLNKYEKLPSRAPTAGALLGSSVPSNTMEEASKTPGNDLLSMLGGRLHLPHLGFELLLWHHHLYSWHHQLPCNEVNTFS